MRPLLTLMVLLSPALLAGSDFEKRAWSFFETHCVECHDDLTAEGGLDLYALDPVMEGETSVHRWTRIHDQVSSGKMPPEEETQPTARERSDFLEWLAPELTRADETHREVVQRRLNRVEYENTIHDLLHIEKGLKHLLPEDQEAGGFDNNGAALAVSAELIERYLLAARTALDEAIVPDEKPETASFTVDSLHEVGRYLDKLYRMDGDRVVDFITARGNYSKISTRAKRLPERGRYRFRFTAATFQSEEPLVFSVVASDFRGVAATYTNLGYFEAKAKPETFEIETVLDEGFAIQFFVHGLPKWINDPAKGDYPGVGFSPVEITGPLIDAWPPRSHHSLFGEVDRVKGTIGNAEAILRDFLPRAFRRPVSPEEITRYTALVHDRLEQGRTFESSLRTALEAALCSPHFLYLQETNPGTELTPHQLASRLSYFLWGSLPDETLRAAADDRSLLQPATLSAQVERMLKDKKAERFVTHFTGQWLHLRDIEETSPDSKLYPEFDELLQVSMVRESESFFRKLLHDDLDIINVIDSDFAMLNRRLAGHYGIEGVSGLELQPVSLPAESVRGGVLTQGAVLKVTANGTNTSPVMRGVWVLENILGEHVPPPPPNIAGIEPDIREATTIREQLDAHRDSESCRSCHELIDPPGFALESFDPVGAYRERYLQFQVNPQHADKGWGKVVEAKPVDASGALASGEAFQSIREFKELLLADRESFARAFAGRLLTYALGRELGFSDRPDVDRIAAETDAKGNGLRTLIHQIVLSEPFRSP